MTDVEAVTEQSVEPVDAPVPATAPSGACPVSHGDASPAATRSAADQFVRRLLRVPEERPRSATNAAHRAFQQSIAVSALRCILTYIVLPIVVPLVGFGAGVAPALGIVIGVVAIVCNVLTIRRFFVADHRWRWQVSALVATIIVILAVLVIQDITQLG